MTMTIPDDVGVVISRVIIKYLTDCVTAHSCRIAINDLT
jgi:hypothetical protein